MSVGVSNLSIFDRFTDAKQAVEFLGGVIHQCGMFGCKRPEQGMILALECLTRRTPPLLLAQTYHLIENTLTMRADAMVARFLDLGGGFEIVSRTPELAAVDITVRGKTTRFSFSWEQAKREPFIYKGSKTDILKKLAKGEQPEIKDNYATPHIRMQMLWARCVSDGIKASDSRANHGSYDAWEIDDAEAMVIEGEAKPTVEVPAITAEQAIQQAEAAYAAQQQPTQSTVAPTLADKAPAATPTTLAVSTAPATSPPPPAAAADSHGHAAEPDAPGYATKLQRMELDRLWAACLIPPVAPEGQHSQSAILRANYKVESARSLTQEQATTLIGNLTKRAAKMAAETAASAANVSELDKFAVTMTKEQRAYAAERLEALRQKMGRPLTDAEELAEAQKVVAESNAKNSQRQALEALPATEEQCNLIRGLARTVEQTEHGTMQRLVELLKSKGISKFAELSQWSANRLIDALQTYQMEAFFTSSIENWRPTQGGSDAHATK